MKTGPIDAMRRKLQRIARERDAEGVRAAQVWAQGYITAIYEHELIDTLTERAAWRELNKAVDQRLTELEALAAAEPPEFQPPHFS
jgi:hypothetical protein